jgi:hypothetical protein
MPTTSALENVIDDFVNRMTAAITEEANQRARSLVLGALGNGGTRSSNTAKASRRPAAFTPKVVRARKIQGQYLGALRRLKGADRIRVKKVAREKSVAEAVKLAAKL